MAEFGSDLWVPLVQPMLHQGPTEQGVLKHVQAVSEELQKEDCLASLAV